MIAAGQYHNLRVVKKVEFGLYLDAEGVELLLPKRFVPKNVKDNDILRVFVYHDSENRMIATTQAPKAIVGEVASLEVISVTKQGAFLDWGLMKDLFLPLSQQKLHVLKGQFVPVYVFIDSQTGRVAATEKFGQYINNLELTVTEKQEVDLFVYRKTELGYEVVVNNKHFGLMHFGDVFRDLHIGDRLKGFIKKVRTDNKLDIMPGEAGYKRVESETEKILRLLHEKNGYLPFHDKSEPSEIYDYFGMSKKTFKMALGGLYKQKRITFAKSGIQLMDIDDHEPAD